MISESAFASEGWAKKQLTRSDIERSEAPIRTAVAAVLEKFPPR